MKNKIDWCKKKKKGIRLIEPNENISRAYFEASRKDLEAFKNVIGSWKIVTGYYCCYRALYSLLMRAGIKCEIHDCTIALMNLFDFNTNEINFMKRLKSGRIATQYYLKEPIKIDIQQIKEFRERCEEILRDLNTEKINNIRSKLASNKT